MNIHAAIALGIEDGLQELGGTLSGCTPSMIAPSVLERIRDLSVASIAERLSSAKPGNRCTVPGFQDWRANHFNGWVQAETGLMIDHLAMAEKIFSARGLLA